MRLYSRTGATVIVAAEGRFEPAEDGGFDLPGTLSGQLHSTHHQGEQLWETAIERQRRMITEEAARRADPRTLLEAVEKLVAQAENPPPKPETAKAAPAAKPAAKAADGK